MTISKTNLQGKNNPRDIPFPLPQPRRFSIQIFRLIVVAVPTRAAEDTCTAAARSKATATVHDVGSFPTTAAAAAHIATVFKGGKFAVKECLAKESRDHFLIISESVHCRVSDYFKIKRNRLLSFFYPLPT
jgi:hypothetical protein